MSIIGVEIMKTIDEREIQKTKIIAKTERSKGNRSYISTRGTDLNPSFKMTTSFVNIARTTASTSKFIY